MVLTTHEYRAETRWVGDTSIKYGRRHSVQIEGPGRTLELSSDGAFGGDDALINPEQLMVAAASSCQLLAFLAVAARSQVRVLEYEDSALGEMPESDGPMAIEKIFLRVRITVDAGTDEARVRRLVEKAHKSCYIANSLKTSIEVEAEVVST